jgi:hypothetical protein
MRMFTGALAAPFLTTALFSVLTVTPAAAQTLRPPDQTYPASMCVPSSFNTSKGFEVDNFGGISNSDLTAPLVVVCPVVKEFFLGPASHPGRSGDVQVIDRHPTADIQCSVMQVGVNGNPFDSVSFHSTGSSGIFPKAQQIGWSKAFFDDADAHFVLNCTIPPAVNNGFICGRASSLTFSTVDSETSLTAHATHPPGNGPAPLRGDHPRGATQLDQHRRSGV